MKSILIVGLCMEIGGAERALLSLLYHLDKSKYMIDLFLHKHTGDFLPLIPPEINLLPEIGEYSAITAPITEAIKNRKFKQVYGRLIGKIKSYQYHKKWPNDKPSAVEIDYSHKYTVEYMPVITNNTYDMVISFCAPHYYVAHKTNGKKKIAWIHTDYSKIDIDINNELKIWCQYDYIASISESVTAGFLSVFPTLIDKIIHIENCYLPEYIRSAAQSECCLPKSKIKQYQLLSVGRYCNAKNFDNIPDICRLIRSNGFDIKWYIIGYGSDEQLIQSKIQEAGMQEYVIMLGKKDNPYPYIAACDLYVQPSRYEGKCVTVREAQILGKPVVITKYATSASQLEDGVDGVIVPMDNEGCAAGIAALLRDPEKMKRLAENCKLRDYSNAQEVEKIYQLME